MCVRAAVNSASEDLSTQLLAHNLSCPGLTRLNPRTHTGRPPSRRREPCLARGGLEPPGDAQAGTHHKRGLLWKYLPPLYADSPRENSCKVCYLMDTLPFFCLRFLSPPHFCSPSLRLLTLCLPHLEQSFLSTPSSSLSPRSRSEKKER